MVFLICTLLVVFLAPLAYCASAPLAYCASAPLAYCASAPLAVFASARLAVFASARLAFCAVVANRLPRPFAPPSHRSGQALRCVQGTLFDGAQDNSPDSGCAPAPSETLDPGHSEMLRGWEQAFSAWLAEMDERLGHEKAQAKGSLWKRFTQFLQGPPWMARGEDVTRWAQALTAQGLRPSSANAYVCALSDFYRFCGQRAPELFPQGKVINPAIQAHRPSVKSYERASCLSAAEVQVLLGVVDMETSIMAKRDYALLLTCLATAWPVGKVRNLRWGEGRVGGAPFDGGEEHRCEAAQKAVEDYLRAAGRWDGMQVGEYVFATFAGGLNRTPSGNRQDWNGGKPLARGPAGFMLKRYARCAGLDAAKVNYQVLRHSARLLHLQAASLLTFNGKQDRTWRPDYLRRMIQSAGIAAKRGRPVDRGPFRRISVKGLRGNQFALRHGLYAKEAGGQNTAPEDPPDVEKLPPIETPTGANSQQSPDTRPKGRGGKEHRGGEEHRRDKAVRRLRWVIRRAFDLGEQAQTPRHVAILLDVMGTAVERLAKLVKGARKRLEEKKGSSVDAEEWIRRMEEIRQDKIAQGEPPRYDQEYIESMRLELFGVEEEDISEERNICEVRENCEEREKLEEGKNCEVRENCEMRNGCEERQGDKLGIEAELVMLDAMIERAEVVGRGNLRLDEGLALLNAVSQAEMRRERCAGLEEQVEQSPDDRLHEGFDQARREVLAEWRQIPVGAGL